LHARSVNGFPSDLVNPSGFENRTGAASNIAAGAVVNARLDGYTLLMAGQTNPVNTTLYDKLIAARC
jgi:tripartite-type tricarboxylate transporter receptor subunit TctC